MQGDSNTGQPLVRPNLQAIVSSLDLQLEAELARYQQQTARTALTQLEREADTEQTETEGAWVSVPATVALSNAGTSVPQSSTKAVAASNAQPLSSYLESSEELLRALAQKQLASPQKSFLDYLFTPLGISSIFLVLVTSALLGLILTTPKSDPLVSKLLPESISAETEAPTQVKQPPIPSSSSPSEDVGTDSDSDNPLNTSAKPEPSPNAAPHSDLASALLAPSLRPQSQQTPEQIPTAQIKSNHYYVLVEDADNSALNQVQNVVEDAYLSKFPEGVRIQVGAFSQQEDAKELVEKLAQQGVSAFIYHAK